MNTEDINRQKTSMLIFALERALGEYVNKHQGAVPDFEQSGTMRKIEGRIGAALGHSRKVRVGDSVAASYLEEVLSMAVDCSSTTSEIDSLKALQQLATNLDLLTIRNAVSHPRACYY